MQIGRNERVYRPLLRLAGSLRIALAYPPNLSPSRGFVASCRSTSSNNAADTRNIGIIAHIDAGKTTTTERMLYYSGYTRRIGNVDEGSTVTDFLPAERARGITIQSAAISFLWPPKDGKPAALYTKRRQNQSVRPHHFNLIDTPGHADFTFEVLRSLRVLDGAICILDGVAGVEAQTEKVWIQANHYSIPRIVYVNKLDREGATFNRTVMEIGAKLHAVPAVCAIPWWRPGDRKLSGTGDVIWLQGLLWAEGSDGSIVSTVPLENLDGENGNFAAELKKARVALVELLSEFDEGLVDKFFELGEDHLAIPPETLLNALRNCVLSSPQSVFPVFAGASFRNLGVQPLLDAVSDLLPSPLERPDPQITLGEASTTLASFLRGDLLDLKLLEKPTPKKGTPPVTTLIKNITACSLAFKVVNDAKRGVLVYVRVYSGRLDRGMVLHNTTLGITEKAARLLKMYASDAVEIDSIETGQIGVIAGLKHTRTGDTLLAYTGMNPRHGPPAPINTLQLRAIDVPPPVFWTSIEPDSLSEERHIDESLTILLREDPSLHVTVDPESGQKHLAGMGELHLEIACDRLLNDFKAKAHIGRIEISYRESLQSLVGPEAVEVEREHAGKLSKAACTISIAPTDEEASVTTHSHEDSVEVELPENNSLTIVHRGLDRTGKPLLNSGVSELPIELSYSTFITSIQNGAIAGIAKGQSYGFPLHSVHISVSVDAANQIFPSTTAAALALAVRQGMQRTLKRASMEARSTLMEPVMQTSINVSERDMGSVVHDLSAARGGLITSLDGDDLTSHPGAGPTDGTTGSVDLRKVYAPPDPFASSENLDDTRLNISRPRQITARVPLREMVGYLKHLRSLTGGRGTFVMQVDRFVKVAGARLNAILKEIKGF